MKSSPKDLAKRKKELQGLQAQLERKMLELEDQMRSSSLLEKEIELEKLKRERERQAAQYSAILRDEDTEDSYQNPMHKAKPFGLKRNLRSYRNRVIFMAVFLFFIVYLIFHAVK